MGHSPNVFMAYVIEKGTFLISHLPCGNVSARLFTCWNVFAVPWTENLAVSTTVVVDLKSSVPSWLRLKIFYKKLASYKFLCYSTFLNIFRANFPIKHISMKDKNEWNTLGIQISCKQKISLYAFTMYGNDPKAKVHCIEYCKILR